MSRMVEDIKKSTEEAAIMKVIATMSNLFQSKSNLGTGVKELLEKRVEPSIVVEKMVALEEAAIYGFILDKFKDETFLQELKEYKDYREEVG